MAEGRGKRTTRSRGLGTGRSESGPSTIDNTTLGLLLQKMNEFQEKLELLSPGNRDNGASSSSRETVSVMSEEGSGSSLTTRNIFVVQPTVDKPNFNGRSQINPITFLKRVKKYIKSLNAHDRGLDIALECVTGHARQVMELYSKGWATFADFEADFRRNYWTEQIQESVRYKIIRGEYSTDSGVSMSEHFAEQTETMQSLTIAFSERDLVNSIMRHYSVDVQQLWFTRTEEPTIINGANFLRNLEQNIVVRQRVTSMRNNIFRNNRQDRRVNQPIAATITTSSYRGVRRSFRGRGYLRGRTGYRTNYNRFATHSPRRDGASMERPAISFVKETEATNLPKSVGADKQKN